MPIQISAAVVEGPFVALVRCAGLSQASNLLESLMEARRRRVTVIALCFNHQEYLLECLESIRTQTFQDFQLIVTDDRSHDQSPAVIRKWLADHRPDAIFIEHRHNVGICKTLNEALEVAAGDYVSMIATDDVWEREKIARQIAFIDACSDQTAVVYSDARCIDADGRMLYPSFIERHRPDLGHPPSGQLFSFLADGNFIPAMATLIRTRALRDIGGYDELLTYEDYDMWLRLADRYEFAYCDGTFARYRMLPTSMVRTEFAAPTARHSHTLFLICEKWLTSKRLSRKQRTRWANRQFQAAYSLYVHGDARAPRCLRNSAFRTLRWRDALLAASSSIGISRARAKRMAAAIGLGVD